MWPQFGPKAPICHYGILHKDGMMLECCKRTTILALCSLKKVWARGQAMVSKEVAEQWCSFSEHRVNRPFLG